jgi:hypothetical protein
MTTSHFPDHSRRNPALDAEGRSSDKHRMMKAPSVRDELDDLLTWSGNRKDEEIMNKAFADVGSPVGLISWPSLHEIYDHPFYRVFHIKWSTGESHS